MSSETTTETETSETAPHTRLIQWATETQNITLSGVYPTAIPNKGLGMAASRDIKKGDILIFAPSSALLTVHPDVPPKRQTHLSLHGRLALALAFPELSKKSVGDRDLAAWKAIMPSYASLRSCMPVLWPADLQASLPPAAAALCAKQKAKMDEDVACAIAWSFGIEEGENMRLGEGIAPGGGDIKTRYTYAWLLVNTRCFYWDYPVLGGALKEKGPVKRGVDGKVVERKRERDDCLAMCPVLDYFNHTDGDGLHVGYNKHGFTVTADQDYAQGQELHISYGKHSNDFLMVEYGFTMTPNSADHISLDHLILPRLSPPQREELETANLLGNYLLLPPTQPLPSISTLTYPPTSATTTTTTTTSSSDLICHRTSCVLRLLLLPVPRWRRYISGLDPTDGAHEQGEVDALLGEILRELKGEVGRAVRGLEGMGVVSGADGEGEAGEGKEEEVIGELQRKEACATLLDRWRRIGEVVEWALGVLPAE